MKEGLYISVRDALETEKELRLYGKSYGCLEEYLADFSEKLSGKADLYVTPSGKMFRRKVKE